LKRFVAATGRLLETRFGELAFRRLARLLFNDRVRRGLVASTLFITSVFVKAGKRHGKSQRIDRERQAFALAVVDTVDKVASRGIVSPGFLSNAGYLWVKALIGSEQDAARARFKERTGVEPPWVLVVAPTGACNLGCPGCYSGSSSGGASMSWSDLNLLIDEAKSLWGIKVLVFTGGEPFLYRSEGKGLLDVVEAHDDLLTLIFTNGTLIDRQAARRLADIGTPTVALSVEGLRGSTDARRGAGAFDTVLRAMDVLREEGAFTGISMTATRRNCEELLSDELLDLFFDEGSVLYGFLFQYMPEGRDPDPDLMPTPEQRLWMWERSWQVIEERKIPLFDFWNHGTLIGGCAAAGRERGYLYVDWNGNVMPCVFAPYSACNINDVHSSGGTLNDAWTAPLLAAIRSWQKSYADCAGRVCETGQSGRLVCACPVRDHYADFAEIVQRTGARPLDDSAGLCMSDRTFTSTMVQYGRDFASLGGPLFKAEYD
jgi:MoaA/NifB/PqqE/SkfB family radical SAM enzyme